MDVQMEEELFNSDYVEVDRVLEVSFCEDKDTGEASKKHSVATSGCLVLQVGYDVTANEYMLWEETLIKVQ